MKNKPNVKYYAYLRKSSEGEDRQVQSIERQADEIHKLITHLNVTVVGTFEECRSAMTPNNRPEFTKMVKGIKAGKANGIICWHINRLARNPLESGIIQQLLEDGKIHSILTKDREYTAADNAIIFSVESSLATQYSKDLGKMVKSGMEKKVSMGISPLKAPIGYLNTKMAEHGANYIITDPQRFPVVRKIWDMMLTGSYTPTAILEVMNKGVGLRQPLRGRKGNQPLVRSAIYKLLANPFYTGMFKYNGQLYQGKHKPMITMAEFERVQLLLGAKEKPRKTGVFFVYTGFMKCRSCMSAITACIKSKLNRSSGHNRTYTYYHCSGRKKGAEFCTSRGVVTEAILEEMILVELEQVSISELFVKLALTTIQENFNDIFFREEAIEKTRQAEIRILEKEISSLLQMRISETITDSEYLAEKKKRENALSLLKHEIESQESAHPFIFNAIVSKIKSLANLKERFAQSSPEDRKRILMNFGWNYTILNKKLFIEKAKWVKLIEEKKKEIEAQLSWLELQEYVDIDEYNKHFSTLVPLMCAIVDEVGNEV